MIAIGGTIGTGLFVGSGVALLQAGPLGALLGYAFVGIFVYFVCMSLAELAAYMPVSGSFNEYASKFIDPSFGFAAGWNYWFMWAVALGVEMTASSLIMSYWLPDVQSWIWSLVVLLIATALNAFTVGAFGEAEFWFSLIKVLTVIIFIIVGLVVVIKDQIGFSSWSAPGAPIVDGFHGFFVVLISTFFAYGGTELVGITAGEAKNPSTTIPKAMKNTFWRIMIFYIGAVFVMGLLVPVSAQGLGSTSPFTLSLARSGVPYANDIINGVIVVALLSASNSAMYASSRTLMALANQGQAPKIFTRTTSNGVPLFALVPTVLLGIVMLFLVQFGAETIFKWLINLTGFTVLIAWSTICLSHLRFRQALHVQRRSILELPFLAPFHPYGDLFALFGMLFAVIGTAVTLAMSESEPIKYLESFVGFIPFFGLFLGHKLLTKSAPPSLSKVDLPKQ
ncbi:lysine-specific permease [Gorgonomyces haynaldii]|nr:lysine-specific permease [Gorgonomyces haynaldii]